MNNKLREIGPLDDIIFKDTFTMLKNEKDYKSTWKWKNSTQKVLTDKMEIVIVELGKIKKQIEAGKLSKKSKIGMWTRILLNPEEIGEEEMDEKEYRETIEKYREIIRKEGPLDRAFVEKMQARERYWQIKDAMDAGERKQQIAIAKKMLKKQLDIDIIIETTGLTKEEIENIDNLESEGFEKDNKE